MVIAKDWKGKKREKKGLFKFFTDVEQENAADTIYNLTTDRLSTRVDKSAC